MKRRRGSQPSYADLRGCDRLLPGPDGAKQEEVNGWPFARTAPERALPAFATLS